MGNLKKIQSLTTIELKKICHLKKYWFLFLITAVFCIVLLLFGTATYSLPYTLLSVIISFFVPLSAIMLSSDLVAAEIIQNELKILLTKPVKRYQIIFAKNCAIAVFCSSLMAASFLISTIFIILRPGFTGVSIVNMLFAYLISTVPLLTFVLLFVLIAVISKSPSASFGCSLFIYIGFMILGILFPVIAAILPTSWLSIGNLIIGIQIPIRNLITGLCLLLGYGCFSFCLSGYLFDKKDFV